MKIFQEEAILDMQILKERQCTCYYDCGGISKRYNLCDFKKMNLEIFQMLFERKINHGLDSYDFESVNSCCVPYNLRVVLKNNTLKPKHLKKFKKHLLEIQAGASQQVFDENNYDKQISYISEESLQQVEQKQFSYTQIKQENEKTKKSVNQDLNSSLIQQIKNCQKQLENVTNTNLSFEIDPTALLLVLNQKKQCYYSNINKLLYLQNLVILQDLDVNEQKFNTLLLESINQIEFQQQYKISLNKFGNLTIETQSELIKNYQIKQELQKIKQQKPNKFKNNPQLKQVIFDDFTFDSFKIGNINVLIKDPSARQEIFDFIENYNIAIHGYNLGEYQMMKLFCKNHFPIKEVLEDKDRNIKIKLGLRQVEYLVNGKLVALGIIFLTRNYFISEYFTYDISYGKGFGIFSMIVEIEYAKKIQEVFPNFNYYTPGYTVAIQPSMSYKLQFNGTQIQCPKTYQWIEYDDKLQQKLVLQPQALCEEIMDLNAVKDLTKVQLLIDGVKITAQQLIDRHYSEQLIKNLNTYFELLGPQLMSLIVFQITPEFSLELDEFLFYSILDFFENEKPDNEFKSYYKMYSYLE